MELSNKKMNEELESTVFFNKGDFRGYVEELIYENPVMVFSKSHCPFCFKLKDFLKEHNIPFECIEIDKKRDGQAIHEVLKGYSK